ncbi:MULTISPECIES: hypothetical protein [Wolbachia]|uniref:Uncharacterized protein n=1 Tax=Wolbachia pipientis TaxID=955 RepID=A0A7G5CBJ1_WOLPI|nr:MULTISPECIES: hypothetical protein [Wolbachia]MDE5061225.1 hypothetical protein [Wolbachia endosymbiont of Drosophila nikananu]MDE5062379.1 hypothetical protein [Wolbachia endosymbiont of Drosophila tsacasi]QMV46575.1 hypothetical protein HC356_03760 [Wolbachia pipientis]
MRYLLSSQHSFLVIPIADTALLCHPSAPMMSFQSGIQVAHKQTSIESGYNVFDEIAGRLDPRLE